MNCCITITGLYPYDAINFFFFRSRTLDFQCLSASGLNLCSIKTNFIAQLQWYRHNRHLRAKFSTRFCFLLISRFQYLNMLCFSLNLIEFALNLKSKLIPTFTTKFRSLFSSHKSSVSKLAKPFSCYLTFET
jgi:hypothetical protein